MYNLYRSIKIGSGPITLLPVPVSTVATIQNGHPPGKPSNPAKKKQRFVRLTQSTNPTSITIPYPSPYPSLWIVKTLALPKIQPVSERGSNRRLCFEHFLCSEYRNESRPFQLRLHRERAGSQRATIVNPPRGLGESRNPMSHPLPHPVCQFYSLQWALQDRQKPSQKPNLEQLSRNRCLMPLK